MNRFKMLLVAAFMMLAITTVGMGNTTYEDAEDGNTAGWRVYDNNPAGATITNVYDNDKASRVIQFSGDGWLNGYMLGGIEGTGAAWNNTQESTIKWSMNYSERFTIYVRTMTANGMRYITYSQSNSDGGLVGSQIRIGLGTESRNGTWQTFTRDLQADLTTYEPGNELLSVNAFMIRGSGLVDDIELLSGGGPDTTAPVITLIGSNPMEVIQGDTFVDPGATAMDNVDGVVPVIESGSVDTSTVESYIRTYTATDSAGNIATQTRIVNVVEAGQAPISLFGSNPVKIMPLGDSITEGYDGTYNTTEDTWVSYRGPLWTKLSAGEYNVDFVGSLSGGSGYHSTDPSFDLDHEGHPGFHADQIASNVNSYLTANPADVLLLHIGTNDLYNSESIESTVSDVNTTLENIDNVSKDIKVIIARIINRETYDPDTTTFNNQLNTMVQQRIGSGDDIMIVDMENGADIDYATDMISDLHPNARGYEKMADQWYSVLSPVLSPIVPIHLWKMDEEPATTTYVDFYSGADGTCTDSGCPVSVAGQVNGSLSFDGTNKIDVTDTTTFNWAADASFTIECWMKTDTDTVDGKNNIMMGRGDATKLSWFLGVNKNNAGTILFGLDDSNDPSANTFTRGTTSVNDGMWHHIAVVRDGVNNENRIYVDGALDGAPVNVTYDADFDEGTVPVTIGYLNWNSYEYQGTLDEIAVFDSSLSEGLIQQHFKNGLKPHLAEVIAVSTPTDVNTPEYTFSTDKAGEITYGGSCSSATTIATVGDNTITFDALADGTYSDCTITVTDAASNASIPLKVSAFVVGTF